MPTSTPARGVRPSLRFFHSPALRTRTNRVLDQIERAKDPTRHASALSDVVIALTEAGLDDYFLRPLREAEVGFVARQTANFGLAGTQRVMSPVIRSIIAGTNAAQLRVIAAHIRSLM